MVRHISDYPTAVLFLTSYWFETADLVYGKRGIRAAAEQFAEDCSKAADGRAMSQRLSADLMQLMTTDFVGEPDWDSEEYRRFWKERGVHRTLGADDIETVLGVLRLGAA